MLGTSESIEVNELFQVEDKKTCIYKRRDVPVREPRLQVFPRAQMKVGHTAPQLEPSDRQGTADAGFDDHLTKPADLEAVNTVLRHARKRT